MSINVNNQKQIFYDLLESTCLDYCATPEKKKGDIIIGVNGNTFSFRNFGMGIISGAIARAVLPIGDALLRAPDISKFYELELLFESDVFELHAFRQGECSLLRYEKGERQLFSVYPDKAPNGILIHIEWKSDLNAEQIVSIEDVISFLRRFLVGKTAPYRLGWKPEVLYNGKHVMY